MSLPAPLRFAVEAALLVAVGIALATADVELVPFVLAMAAAWILVAAGERVLARVGETPEPFYLEATPRAAEVSPRPTSREAPPPAEPEPAAAEEREPETQAEQGPEPERALEAVPAQAELEPEPEEEPEAEPELEPEEEPDVVALPQAVRRRPDGWNLWDLEQRVHEREGEDPMRDEEWGALLMSLRGYASPDGTLPPEFDALVQESFAELISTRA